MDNLKVRNLTDYRSQVAPYHGQTVPAFSPAPSPPKPKLLDQVRQAIRTRHYSYMTEKAYVGWIKRFIFFHNNRHPAEMGEAEIAQFLSSLGPFSEIAHQKATQATGCVDTAGSQVYSRLPRSLGLDHGLATQFGVPFLTGPGVRATTRGSRLLRLLLNERYVPICIAGSNRRLPS